MEVFSAHFFVSSNSFIKTIDATFILSYSVIMLNTDQHNPQVKKRMTFDEFKRNTRGVNDGGDFDVDYLVN